MKNLLLLVFTLAYTVGMGQVWYDDYPYTTNLPDYSVVPLDYMYAAPVRVIIVDYCPVVDPYYMNIPNQWNYNTISTPMPVNQYWIPVQPWIDPRFNNFMYDRFNLTITPRYP